jgi:hypothetical protein
MPSSAIEMDLLGVTKVWRESGFLNAAKQVPLAIDS